MYRLREARTNAKMKQKEVATLLNITPATYSRYESGQIDPDPKTLIKLSELFGTTVDDLLIKDNDENKFNLQMFGKKNASDANVAMAFGKILTLKDEEAKKLTLQIMDEVLHLSIPKLEALHSLIKTMK
jgi:transcriptional regulator with XRE-family HTH domain